MFKGGLISFGVCLAMGNKFKRSTFDLTFVVMTKNEQINLPYLLKNISGLGTPIFVLDSFSNDDTVKIARDFGAEVFFREFDNYSNQRRYALFSLEYKTEWVFFLDADEFLSDELKENLGLLLADPNCDGYYFRRRFYWLGAWIRRGYYPVWLLRLGRVGCISCDDRPINEHLICLSNRVKYVALDFSDQNRKTLSWWVAKHNDYSSREAEQYVSERSIRRTAKLTGLGARKRRFWDRLPLLIRPFLYFGYRYFIKGGFLEGYPGFSYHLLHALFYRLLIDFKILEILIARRIVDKGKIDRH